MSVQQEKGSDGKSEWVFKAAEGAEGKEAVLTIQNGTQKKEIKVKVTAKGNTVPDFKERSVETKYWNALRKFDIKKCRMKRMRQLHPVIVQF